MTIENMLKKKLPNIQTLAELYHYCTQNFASNIHSYSLDHTILYTYSQFREQCESVSRTLSNRGIGATDKVAILSENMPNWTIAFFSLVAYGRVAVPILPEMSAAEINNILIHSDAKGIFISHGLLKKIDAEVARNLTIIDIATFEIIHEHPSVCEQHIVTPKPDDLAAIVYTSGTSGTSKGVMLSHKNFCHNIIASYHACYATQTYTWLSILPMAHTYQLCLGVLYPMYVGANVCYLMRMPSPSILLSALKQEKPQIICSVPLIIEKIYYKSILPTIQSNHLLSWMQKHIPWILFFIIGIKLRKIFGGKLTFFGVGGAKLNTEVESFLHKCHFPYAIGYGMTETAPLICNASVGKTKLGSTGIPAYGVKIKLINQTENGEGEIVVKGDNVMLGYYKNPELTKQAFTEDGWLRTHDIATIDSKGRVYIQGRADNMILGSAGNNIYPENIESVLNNFDDIEDSLVIEKNGHLIALIKLYDNLIDWSKESEEEVAQHIANLRQNILTHANSLLGQSSRISHIHFMKTPFEKTATKKIKRYLYRSFEKQS